LPETHFDLAVVGAGVIGLAHALAAARLGKHVVVLDRDAQANGASIRNFGFVTVTGQQRGEMWRLARRSRDVWVEIAEEAGIAIEHHGLAVVAQRPEARAVLEAFMLTEMAEGCAWLSHGAAATRLKPLRPQAMEGALLSEVDVRLDSRRAIPALASWLQARHGVDIRRGVAVHGVETGRLETTGGLVTADAVVVCPGDDLATLFPEQLTSATRCKLQMLRLAPPGWRLPAAVMSDLSLLRYGGYADLPEAAALKARLQAERPEHLAQGVHLIVVQNGDGSLVVGDSHHYAATPDPFRSEAVDQLILDEFQVVFGRPAPAVLERWTGTYASAAAQTVIGAPARDVRVVTVTNGTGASIGFGLAEQVVADLFHRQEGAAA
jgi:D-hydroxyproline dehydrogenase subunit beta